MEATTALAKYVFLDVVKFSLRRSVEAQSDIIKELNRIVLESIKANNLEEERLLLLPTGDGICITILNVIEPYDIHISIALSILERLHAYNEIQSDESRKFSLRIGINENQDNLVTDINGRKNIAGAGINYAQRIMNMAEDNQICLSESVHDKLKQREKYLNKFIRKLARIKHDQILYYCRFVDKSVGYLNNDVNEVKEDPKPTNKLPEITAYIMACISLLKEHIYKNYGSYSDKYPIFSLIYYIADDIIRKKKASGIAVAKWESRIFKGKIDSFEKAFKLFDDAFFWVVADLCDYLIEKHIGQTWDKYFQNEYLEVKQEGLDLLNNDWPGLYEEVKEHLSTLIKNPNGITA